MKRLIARTFAKINFTRKYKVPELSPLNLTEVVTNVHNYSNFIKFCSKSEITEM